MNVFMKEMRSNLISLIIWSVSSILLILIAMMKYLGFAQDAEATTELLNSLPKGILAAFGMDVLNVATMKGYYAVLFIYFVLIATIHAAMLGATIISKEERDKTSEFLFPKPRKRSQIIAPKILAAMTNVVILNIVIAISSILLVAVYNQDEPITAEIIKLMGVLLILQTIFLTFGTVIASFTSNTKTSGSVATGILLITYFFSIAVDIDKRLDNLKYFSPFKYFDPKLVMLNESFEPIYYIISVALIVLFTTMTFILYERRDISL